MFLLGRRRKTSCHPWGCSARPGDAREAQGHGWVQGLGRMREVGDQGVAAAEEILALPLSALFPCHFKYQEKTSLLHHIPSLAGAEQCCPRRKRAHSRLNIQKYCQMLFKIIVITFKLAFHSLFSCY